MIRLIPEENVVKSGLLLGNINSIIADFRKFCAVRVEAYGSSPMYWSEDQVRAFQVLVHNSTDEEYEDLKKNVIISSGPKFDHKMIFRRDGKFENEFEQGFYDVTANMAYEIL